MSRALICKHRSVRPRGTDGCSRVQTVGIIGRTANPTNLVLEREWRALGIDAQLLGPAEAGLLRAGDVAIGRLDVRRTLDGIEPGLLELHALARRGVRVLNGPRALLGTHDKLRTCRLLRAAGLRHPLTEHLPVQQLPRLTPPLVLKPRFGSWGSDVVLCDNRLQVERALTLLAQRHWFARQGVLVQELIAPRGYDLRLVVAGGRIVGAVRRCARAGEWRTNISLGGCPEPVRPPPEARARLRWPRRPQSAPTSSASICFRPMKRLLRDQAQRRRGLRRPAVLNQRTERLHRDRGRSATAAGAAPRHSDEQRMDNRQAIEPSRRPPQSSRFVHDWRAYWRAGRVNGSTMRKSLGSTSWGPWFETSTARRARLEPGP